ncbi:MAG: hypothetical protein K2H52_11330 [Lachnospiraceae bacterium]|nr:hypothetical protein [Lachnospiraceae bacterium]
MKKKMICGLAFLSMSALLTGCHMKHEWVEATCVEPRTCSVGGETEGEPLGHTWAEATCTEPRTCSVCRETEGEALDHEWVEATYDAPKTCSVCSLTEGESLPKPYFLEEGIVCEELRDFELPINMSFIENNELVEIDDGAWLEYDNARYTFGEITSEPAQQEGYLTVTIPYEISFSYDVCCYSYYYDLPEAVRRQRNILDVCDYYTGSYMHINSDSETYREFEWEGNAYSINVLHSSSENGEALEWITEGNIDRLPFWAVVSEVLTITIPEGYDGAVLYIRRDKPDIILETEQGGGDAGDGDLVGKCVCDEDSPEAFMFFRLSDIIQ